MTTDRSKSDDSYEEGSFQASKPMTVTRMATTWGPIPVTVDTFEASGGDTMGEGWERGAQTHINPYNPRFCLIFQSRASPLDFP